MRCLIQPAAAEKRVILTHCEVPTADASANEHLIRVHAAAPCAGELLWAKNFPLSTPKELIPCVDFAGTVVTAPAISPFSVGDEVFARTNYVRPGTGRDYCIAVTDELAHRPKTLSWVESTAVPVSSLTAWQALFVQAGIGEFISGNWRGKRILITAASGGVGMWAVQLAHLAGATVIGTCGPDNVELVKSLGASEVINYRATDMREWAQTPGKKVDVVLDCVGGKSLEDAWWCVKDGGHLLSIFQPPKQVQPAEYKGKDVKDLFFIMSPNGLHLKEITKLVEQGKCRPMVDSVWPLEQFEEAFKRMDSGHARGKIILDLSLNNPEFKQ
jgi:NADPH:quinone reductase-like Zn-dependent oxidoreductase